MILCGDSPWLYVIRNDIWLLITMVSARMAALLAHCADMGIHTRRTVAAISIEATTYFGARIVKQAKMVGDGSAITH